MTTPWLGAAAPRTLSDEHFARAAERLRCEPAAIRAVWEVEARGRHFREDGTVERRFEPHHFPRQHWPSIGYNPSDPGAAVIARAAARWRTTSPRPWQVSVLVSSEAMFQNAARIDTEAACRASSWGAPQIMGFHHRGLGFGTASEMVRHMAAGAPEQLGAFVQFIEGQGLASALRAHDWLAFGRGYNGSGQPVEYASRMEAAYRRHSGRRSPVVLRVGDRGAAVRELQQALGVDVDGAFGPETLAAVRDFQADRGLAVDGVVGARTWAALQARPVVSTRGDLHPFAQPTPTEDTAESVSRWAGAVGAVSAVGVGASEALGGLREALGEVLFLALIGGGGLTVAVALVLPRLTRRRA